jgi:hypothetical protein
VTYTLASNSLVHAPGFVSFALRAVPESFNAVGRQEIRAYAKKKGISTLESARGYFLRSAFPEVVADLLAAGHPYEVAGDKVLVTVCPL